MYISHEEMHFFNVITLDELGEVFEWNGHILRGIKPQKRLQVLSYFESGFIDEIIEKGLFPETKITAYENERYCMILEHERILPPITDSEWSFSMMKDAALMVLDIAQIGMRYGYNMQDCHTKNVMFKSNHPIYVDLGSFVPMGTNVTGFVPYHHFLSSYYYILKMWADGLVKIPKQLHTIAYVPEKDYILYKYPLWRMMPNLLSKYLSLYNRMYQQLCCTDHIELYTENHFKRNLVLLLQKIVAYFRLFPGQRLNIVQNKIKKIHQPSSLKYSFQDEEDIMLVYEVKQLIQASKNIMIINSDPFSLIVECEKFDHLDNILVVDNVESKGDSCFCTSKARNLRNVSNAVFNFCFPLIRCNSQKSPEQRLNFDLVIINQPKKIESDIKKPIQVLYKSLRNYHFKHLVVFSQNNVCVSERDYSDDYIFVNEIQTNNNYFAILDKK